MAVSAHPPEVNLSGNDHRNRSGTTSSTSTSTSSSSRRESLSSARSSSESSILLPSSYSRRTHVYCDRPPSYMEDQKEDEERVESFKDAERQRIINKRDYAIEISKIMGKQLVSTLRKKGHNGNGTRGAS